MLSGGKARPGRDGGGRATEHGERRNGHSALLYPDGCLLTMVKRGKVCRIAKLVRVRGEPLLGVPYRNRRRVEACVSLPPRALDEARRWGARRWVVRFDLEGTCISLPLDRVESVGWLHASEGRPEWFVPLDAFSPCAWVDWAYIPAENAIALGPQPNGHCGRQLSLFGAVP